MDLNQIREAKGWDAEAVAAVLDGITTAVLVLYDAQSPDRMR